jgi:hypothetical protein
MTGEMDTQAAFELTTRIRNSTHELGQLIRQARDGRVWLALGFSTFDEWTNESFGWHRSRAYQLLNMAILDEQVREAVQMPETWVLSDKQTRAILHIGANQFLESLTAAATNDAGANARKVVHLISQLTPGTAVQAIPAAAATVPIQRNTPSIISNGVRNSRTAVHMANSLAQQARMLPRAEQVSPTMRARVASILDSAIRDANTRLDEFDEAVQDRLSDGASQVG